MFNIQMQGLWYLQCKHRSKNPLNLNYRFVIIAMKNIWTKADQLNKMMNLIKP